MSVESSDARLDLQIRALSQERVAKVRVSDPQVCLDINTLEEFRAFADQRDGTLPKPEH